MKLTTLPLLRPLFTAIARQPLIGPHVQHEVDLLRSGSKPVGMFAPADPAVAELQADVDAGRLIRLDVSRTLPRAIAIYALPGTDMALAEQAAIYQMRFPSEGRDTYPAGREALTALARQASISVLHSPSSTGAAEFIDGKHAILFAPDYTERFSVWQGLKGEFDTRISNGRIVARKTECTADCPMVVFGQPGREEDMDTLAIILREAYAGRPLPAHIDDNAEGRILGYSDRDIAAFSNRIEQNKEMNWLLRNTHERRRNLRIALMKEAGPNWPRNP